jgi:hypothetical protein
VATILTLRLRRIGISVDWPRLSRNHDRTATGRPVVLHHGPYDIANENAKAGARALTPCRAGAT